MPPHVFRAHDPFFPLPNAIQNLFSQIRVFHVLDLLEDGFARTVAHGATRFLRQATESRFDLSWQLDGQHGLALLANRPDYHVVDTTSQTAFVPLAVVATVCLVYREVGLSNWFGTRSSDVRRYNKSPVPRPFGACAVLVLVASAMSACAQAEAGSQAEGEPAGEPAAGTQEASNQLTPEEVAEGFELLFDGASLDAWRGFQMEDVPGGWSAIDGALAFTPGVGGGTPVTRETYTDFDLRLEWKVGPSGNSGIFFGISENTESAFQSGAELQVLDNAGHYDGGNPLTSTRRLKMSRARSANGTRCGSSATATRSSTGSTASGSSSTRSARTSGRRWWRGASSFSGPITAGTTRATSASRTTATRSGTATCESGGYSSRERCVKARLPGP